MTAVLCREEVSQQVSLQPEHTRAASLPSAEPRHSMQREMGVALESYTHSHLLLLQ